MQFSAEGKVTAMEFDKYYGIPARTIKVPIGNGMGPVSIFLEDLVEGYRSGVLRRGILATETTLISADGVPQTYAMGTKVFLSEQGRVLSADPE